MGGGLMQLVAYGAQDIYLTGNPQITFFKVVYRRHTNFAVESIEQTFSGSASSKVPVTVSRNGDLLSRVWVQGDTNLTGFANIDYVECEIGGHHCRAHSKGGKRAGPNEPVPARLLSCLFRYKLFGGQQCMPFSTNFTKVLCYYHCSTTLR